MANPHSRPHLGVVPYMIGFLFVAMLAFALYRELSERGVFLTADQKEEQRLQQLAFEARGMETRRDSVRAIAQSQHPVATRLLLDIALDGDLFPQNRAAAITELRNRGDLVSGDLSSLLSRDESLLIRKEVVRTLEDKGCDSICSGQILRYLRNPHKQAFLPMQPTDRPSTQVLEDLRREHQRMVTDLIDVVLKVVPPSDVCSAIADADETELGPRGMARRKELCARPGTSPPRS